MSGFRKHLWQNLKNRVFRSEYVAENAKTGVAMQIKAMREARNWSQADLAERANKAQSAIARLEDPDYGRFNIQTLLEMAAAFDVWLSVEFVPFSIGLQRTVNRSRAALAAISFVDDRESSQPEAVTTATFLMVFEKMKPNVDYTSALIKQSREFADLSRFPRTATAFAPDFAAFKTHSAPTIKQAYVQ